MASVQEDLAAYAAQLMQDLDSKRPTVYAPVVWAYQEDEVRDRIARRIESGEVLTSSTQIVPDRALRRERVYFAFTLVNRLDVRLPGILVQLADDNSVVEILDPCDLNKRESVPLATTATDTFPLFASRATTVGEVDDEDAAAALAARWAQYVQQPALARSLGLGSSGAFGGLGGVFAEGGGSVSGGTPTRSAVISNVGSKEDPDQDTRGGHFDDLL